MWWRAIHRGLGFCTAFLILLLATASCVAESTSEPTGEPTSGFTVPYNSYVFDFWGKSVPSPQAYVPARIVTGSHLGVGELNDPSDICVAPDKTLYIVDSGNHRIIHTDSNFSVLEIIKQFDNNGTTDTFRTPRGICVAARGSCVCKQTRATPDRPP